MAIEVNKIDSSSTPPVVDFHILQIPRAAAKRYSYRFYPIEDSVKLILLDMKGIMITFGHLPVIKIKGQSFVYLHRREMPG